MKTETEYWKKIENLVNRALLIIVQLDKIGKRSLSDDQYSELQHHLNLLYSPLKGFIEGAEQFLKLNEAVKTHVKEIESRVEEYESYRFHIEGWEDRSFRTISLVIKDIINAKLTETQKTKQIYDRLMLIQRLTLERLFKTFNKWTFSSDKIKREFAYYLKKLIDVILELLKLLKREEKLEEYEIRGFREILQGLNIILQTRQIPIGSTSKLLKRLEDEERHL